jgi:hypothetical protein
LYGNTSIEQEPMSAGRQMGGHFATHSLNDGSWKNLTQQKILVLISLLLRANATIIRFSTSFQNISTSKGITNKVFQ